MYSLSPVFIHCFHDELNDHLPKVVQTHYTSVVIKTAITLPLARVYVTILQKKRKEKGKRKVRLRHCPVLSTIIFLLFSFNL